MTLDNDELEGLLGRCARRDAAALKLLYARTSPQLLGILVHLLGTHAAAEDALQDVFIRIWQQAGQFDCIRGRAMAWMVAIARNRAIDLQRVNRPMLLIDAAELSEAEQLQVEGAGERVEFGATHGTLLRCLERLGDPQRQYLLLAYQRGLTQDRIAGLIGQPPRDGQELGATGVAEPEDLQGIMNYERPELLDRLAAQYVLGCLRHGARARFERLCTELASALAARMSWEDRLLPLSLAVPPIAPNPNRWLQVERAVAASAGPGVPLARRRPGVRRRWWAAAVAASLIAVALLVGKFAPWNQPTWQQVALLRSASGAPLSRLERSPDAQTIDIRAVGAVTARADKSYELWILPQGAGNPVSLGLLPSKGELQRRLTPAQRALLLAAAQVAVSVEPAGGSPTGQPAGPVVIVAPILRAT